METKNPPVDMMRAAYLDSAEKASRNEVQLLPIGTTLEKFANRSVKAAGPVLIVGIMAPLGMRLGRLAKAWAARRHDQPIIIDGEGKAKMPEAA